MTLRAPYAVVAGFIIAALAGCGAINPPAHLFMLEPAARHASPAALATAPVTILVNPTSVPDYLDRLEIVARTGANELHLIESDQWAERLSVNISRVLAENLSAEVPSDAFMASAARNGAALDYQVALTLDSFEFDESGAALLAGRWSISNGAGTHELAAAKVALREPPGGPGTAQGVAAMSRNLDVVSQNIAAGIQKLVAAGRASGAGSGQ
jgi:uncharacterized lipoprotein YmbA